MKINDYMTINEAAYRWDIKIERLKERLKPSRNKGLEELIECGIIKHFKHPDKARGEWILSKEFMEKYYGKENKKE